MCLPNQRALLRSHIFSSNFFPYLFPLKLVIFESRPASGMEIQKLTRWRCLKFSQILFFRVKKCKKMRFLSCTKSSGRVLGVAGNQSILCDYLPVGSAKISVDDYQYFLIILTCSRKSDKRLRKFSNHENWIKKCLL